MNKLPNINLITCIIINVLISIKSINKSGLNKNTCFEKMGPVS